ncbi:DUF6924 domain-containing protein [Streptomyces sp. NPDC056488]|uniref:DUF6924 domain-containing protein n=1 Tax=Streptomyces sp. NPDC056488 TaxID=3345836 RepID=UPI0036A80861
MEWPTGCDKDAALIIRTDYEDEQAWSAVKAALPRNWGEEGFAPYVHIIDDPKWTAVTPARVLFNASAHAEGRGVAYLADHATMRESPVALLALSLLTREQCESDEEFEAYGGAFCVVSYGVHEMNANLMVANLDFGDFADTARDDPPGGLPRIRRLKARSHPATPGTAISTRTVLCDPGAGPAIAPAFHRATSSSAWLTGGYRASQGPEHCQTGLSMPRPGAGGREPVPVCRYPRRTALCSHGFSCTGLYAAVRQSSQMMS